jgi:ribosomal protein S18 acetylase RimI-like enzyme
VISTRRATEDDIESVAALFDAYRQFYRRAPDLELARQFIAARLRRNESVIFVAQTERGLVGFTQLYPTFCSVSAASIYVLYDLFVSSEARGVGAGKALMLAAEAHAVATGATRMDLSTAIDNHVAQKLYESLGWVRDETYYVYNRTLLA